ncbi:hypothetical protein FHS95_001974 [Sphingomonas naasensis]|nr:hypothetical protein [Sphingomonas naasensis]NIJ20282.1 hypothetical protein [Sphingomonas naasensis]
MPPAASEAIKKIAIMYRIPEDSYILDIYREFDGFDGDFDAKSLLNLWGTGSIIDAFEEFGTRSLLPFSDFSFMTDVYCLRTNDPGGSIWGELNSAHVDLNLNTFFAKWLGGGFDHELGIFSS